MKTVRRYFKKADLVLFVLLLLLGAASVLAVQLLAGASDAAVVTVNGETYGTYPLSQDREIRVETEYGSNVLTIRSGAVSVTESDCPNHDCEGFAPISRSGQVIMCLPHRLVVTVSGSEEPEVDAVLF